MNPRYIVYVNSTMFYTCSTLAEALDIKKEFGGMIYELLGQTTAEAVSKDGSTTVLIIQKL